MVGKQFFTRTIPFVAAPMKVKEDTQQQQRDQYVEGTAKNKEKLDKTKDSKRRAFAKSVSLPDEEIIGQFQNAIKKKMTIVEAKGPKLIKNET